MRTVDVHIDAFHFFGVNIARNVRTLVDDQNGLTRFLCFLCKNCTIQTGTDYQIIIFFHIVLPFPLIASGFS